MKTLEELQNSTIQVVKSVDSSTVNHALYKSGYYGKVLGRKPNKSVDKSHCGQMRTKCNLNIQSYDRWVYVKTHTLPWFSPKPNLTSKGFKTLSKNNTYRLVMRNRVDWILFL